MAQQRLAWMFPGQGTQAVGMGRALYDSSPAARCLMDAAAVTLGGGVLDRCFDGPDEELRLTVNAQQAIVVVSLASLLACSEFFSERSLGGTPDKWFGPGLAKELTPAYVAGHSIGELSGLIAAGAISLTDGLLLVQARAQAMQVAGAARPGTMAAVIGLKVDDVEASCTAVRAELPDSYVTIATHNEPTQVVIAGDEEGVKIAGIDARRRGARRVVPLKVSAAFHSAAMRPAVTALTASLETLEIHAPIAPVVLNTSAQPTRDPNLIRSAITEQVSRTVRWSDTVGFLLSECVTAFLECGPGAVLSSTVRRRTAMAETWSVSTPGDVRAAVLGLRAHWG